MADRYPLTRQLCTMLKGDHSFHRRWEIVLADNETSPEKPPFYIRRFFLILVLLGLFGGFLALTVPLWKSWAETPKTNFIEFIIGWIGSVLSSFIPPSDADKYPDGRVIADVRLHILYITGGIIAILTLLQTNWKNQVDHRKVEDDIQKNKNDHDLQVHAERRSRYTKAVEQLANEKVAVRLGGIYTLVGLVDEWIDDDALNPEERQKEGQIIINNLCSYIRSPFSLAIDSDIMPYDGINYDMTPEDYEGDYRGDQAKLMDEQETRISIFKEISSRIDDEDLNKSNQKYWNNFSYDFSRSVIFYPLRNLSFSGADFSLAIFIGDTSFESSQFLHRTSFAGGYFKDGITFKNAYFKEGVDFSYANFEESADFSGLQSTGSVIFQLSKIPYDTDFSESYFPYNCKHIWNFIQRKDKPGVKYGSTDLILPNNEVVTKNLPVGARLFDPDSWDEEIQDYTRFSNPAQHIENSTCSIKRVCKKIKKRLP